MLGLISRFVKISITKRKQKGKVHLNLITKNKRN